MEKIAKIISDIENWHEKLKNLKIKSIADLKDDRNFYSASMLLFSILNGAIDIGKELIATRKLRFPTSYREIFQILAEAGIIDEKMEKKLSGLVFYRNLFAHEYYSFTKKDVWSVHKRIGIIRNFVKKIREVLK